MDEVIFEEFKGRGNMELVLERKIAERRIFPAIDVKRSGTRREELLLNEEEMELNWNLRNAFSEYNPVETMQLISDTMRKTKSNEDLLRAAPVVFGRNGHGRKSYQ
jgi:transcription termination factor Rho